jgi:hypothetical protein
MVTHGSCSLNRRVSGTYTVKMRLCTPTSRVVIMIYMTNSVCSLTIQQHCMYHSVISLMNCSLLHYHPISKTNKLHYKASTSAIRDHSQWTGKFWASSLHFFHTGYSTTLKDYAFFICGLFNDAVNSWDYRPVSPSDTFHQNVHETELSLSKWSYYQGIYLDGLKKITKHRGSDLLAEIQSTMLSTR